jgi:hypothetical protein
MTGEMKAIATFKEVPPVLPGTNMDAFQALFKMLRGARLYDYREEEDYHRKGTTVHRNLSFSLSLVLASFHICPIWASKQVSSLSLSRILLLIF